VIEKLAAERNKKHANFAHQEEMVRPYSIWREERRIPKDFSVLYISLPKSFSCRYRRKGDLLSEWILRHVSIVRSCVYIGHWRRKRRMGSRAGADVLQAAYQENLNANNKYH